MYKMITDENAEVIAKFVKETSGNIAEVGVSIGDTAEVICQNKGDRTFYLFDTFTGHPFEGIIREKDATQQKEGKHVAKIEDVQERLKYPNLIWKKGFFPDTAEGKDFGFVNLDTDLYIGTFEGLKYFYPRMRKGGVILIHDYPDISGVRKAVDEFGIKGKQLNSNQYLIR